MAYDERLAERLRDLLAAEEPTEMKMFGGLAFLVAGNMAVVASSSEGLMVRVDPAEADALAAEPHAAPMVMRGRPMRGWVTIAPAGLEDDEAVATWAHRGVAYARALPPK